MTDAGQQSLDDFGTDRPAAEARAVVGADPAIEGEVIDPAREALPAVEETIEIGITQVDYTIAGRGDDERPLIHVFGRTADGRAEHVRVTGFRPYFYAPAATVDDDELLTYDRITDWEYTDADGEPFRSIRDEELVKIYGQTPRDVGEIRTDFDHYEADVLFPNRFLIDKDIESGIRVPARRDESGQLIVHHEEVTPTDLIAEPRVCMLDIEVDDRNGFPEEGEERIVCLTAHDSVDDEYVCWLYEPPEGTDDIPTDLPSYEFLSGRPELDVRAFATEEAMLDDVLRFVEERDVDILSGWNFTDFDAPYLLDRLDRLDPRTDYDLSVERLSRVDEVWRSDWGGPSVKGRVVFDLLYAYQRTKFTELDSYRLDDVGERELGVGKERYPGDIGDLWEDDPEQLLAYNLRDVELCVELNTDQEIIPFWNEVRSFVGCKLEDATTPGDAVDVYVLHKAHGRFVLPSKGQQDTEDYEGGAVFDPVTGVKENVTVLDLASLYPMSMRTINASPETKVDPDTYDGKTFRAPNGTHFQTEPDGIIREIITETLDEREEKKALRNEYDPEEPEYQRYDRQQAAVKVIMNCFTPDTEVLTPAGVRNIRDLEVGDKVYALDPETTELTVKPVAETHKYPDYRGTLIDIQTDETDFRVTPNHRMLVRSDTDADWDYTEAGALEADTRYELPHGWDGPDGQELETVDLTRFIDDYEIRVEMTAASKAVQTTLEDVSRRAEADDAYILTDEQFEAHREEFVEETDQMAIRGGSGEPWIPRTYDGDAFLQVLAVYAATGTDVTEQNISEIERDRMPAITDGGQTSRRSEKACDRPASVPEQADEGRQIASPAFSEVVQHLIETESSHRRIPELVFDTTDTQQRRFLETLVEHGGEHQPDGWSYTTPSEEFRDDLLRLCTHCGLRTRYAVDGDAWRVRAVAGTTPSFRMDRDGGQSTATEGVYSVTVAEHHNLLAGRNGTFQWTGNSLYGVLGWDRFRLYDKEMGAAVTATGREVISFTETAANELGYDVAYGDSVTGDRPVVVRDPDGRVRILPIADLFERGTAEQELFVSADGETVPQPVQTKSRRSLDGWEALSLQADGEPEWQPIQQAIRHETDKPVVRLQHPKGASTTTRDHAYIVADGEGYTEAPPERVEEPLRIPGLPAVKTVSTLETQTILADEADVQVDTDHVQLAGSTTTLPRQIDPDSEKGQALFRLLGAYARGGSGSSDTISLTGFDRATLRQRRTDYDQLVETEATGHIDTEAGPKLRLTNSLVASLIQGLVEGSGIPSIVFHVTDTAQQAFLDGFTGGTWPLETTSQAVAAGVSTLLTQREETHSFTYRETDGAYVLHRKEDKTGEPVRTAVAHEGAVYDLSVANNDNFVDAVGGIVLHNTDSVMLELGSGVSKEEAIEQSFEIEEHINDRYDEFARETLNATVHHFQIEFEKLYRRFFQAGKKKRYAGHIIWKEGKDVDDIDITGFEYQRSDIAPLTKEVQREVIERIVYGKDRDAITEYLHDVIEEVLEGELDPEEIAIPGGIGKRLTNYDTPTAHVRGARYANLLLGTNFARGSKPKRIYLKKVHPEFFRRMEAEEGLDPHENDLYREFKRDPDVICFEYTDQLPEEFEIDWETMLEKTLRGPIARILEALDISWEEVRSGQEQTGLGQFT